MPEMDGHGIEYSESTPDEYAWRAEIREKNRQLALENAERLDMYDAERRCEKCGFEVMDTMLVPVCYTRKGWALEGSSLAAKSQIGIPLMHRRCGRCKNERWERPLDWPCTT